MKVTLSRHCATALAGLGALQSTTKPSAPPLGRPFVERRQRETRRAIWLKRYQQALALCGTSPMTFLGALIGAALLALALGKAPINSDATEHAVVADTNAIRHHAQQTQSLRIVAEPGNDRARKAIVAALTVLEKP